MPTGEIAPQHAHQMEGKKVQPKDWSPQSLSPVNPAQADKQVVNPAQGDKQVVNPAQADKQVVNLVQSDKQVVNPVQADKQVVGDIEVFQHLVWKGWQPGKEHIKTLVLKNVSFKTQKLKYKSPASKYFTTLYPQTIFLSAGTNFSLPVTFKPIENIEYTDKIVFTLREGLELEVGLKAVLPQVNISLPIDLDFKMCAVLDSTTIVFDVYNIGDLDTPLSWQVPGPFSIHPLQAELKCKSSAKFTVTFTPQAAFVYEVQALCQFGKDLEYVGKTTFYGVGKFPHLLVSCVGDSTRVTDTVVTDETEVNAGVTVLTEVNFGQVGLGVTMDKLVELRNLSPVSAPFKIERNPGMHQMDTVFHIQLTHGLIPPMSMIQVPLTFEPHTDKATSIDYFRVTSVSHISHSVLKCIGTGIGPRVELSSDCINFKLVNSGSFAVRTFDVINNCDFDAVFQFQIDCEESVFQLSMTSGLIKEKSTQTVTVKFCPLYAMNYYRRVTCLVHNQLPLFLDLLGTCHSDLCQPAVLHRRHLLRFQTHVQRGLSYIAPEQLNDLVQSGRLSVDETGCLLPILEEDKVSLTPNSHPKEIPGMDEYFNDGFHSDIINILPHVSTNVNILDFGCVQHLNLAEERTVNITNHTRGKVSVQWMGDSTHVFSVKPVALDIPALKSCSFRVSFRPAAPNQIYGNELECFVYYKTMRDYRLVKEETHCPPWCLTITCLGYTFMPGNIPFMPRAVLSPRMVVFPALNTEEHTYRTLLLSNSGDTPILFDFSNSFVHLENDRAKCGAAPHKSVFSIKPTKGIVKSGHQVSVIRIIPSTVETFSQDVLVRLNGEEKYDQMIGLCGSAEMAQVLLDTEGNMYFKPTCVGTFSCRTYSFRNISRIPLLFQWKLSKQDESCLRVEPSCGLVQPNEIVSQIWTFTPTEEKKYVLKVTLVAWGQGQLPNSSGGRKQCFTVRVIGVGSIGGLQSDQAAVDFGDILVGSSASCPVNIYNNSDCSLQYRLLVDSDYLQDRSSNHNLDSASFDKSGVEFDTMEGQVPARGKTSITATIRATRRIHYQFSVYYMLVTPLRAVHHPAVLEPQHLINLLATGVYPSMVVTDIRSQGSAVGLSKKILWDLFSLNQLNHILDSDPSMSETASGRQSIQPRQTFSPKHVLDFNFSAAPLDSEPCNIVIMFKNNRTVICEWSVLFPKDMHVEMGYWSQSGQCSQDQLHEMKVVDNKIFEVSPKKGVLGPGQSVAISLTYQHTVVGTHRLPLHLKIAKGKEVLLSLIGVTVDHTQAYLHFSSQKHSFSPMPIGLKISPTQTYYLINGGAVPVSFSCDLTPLDVINRENFNQPIFECLTAKGDIQPGQVFPMQWRFSPLEAKQYKVDVPIQVQNGDLAIITFSGVGYDPRVMGDTMPVTDGFSSSGIPVAQMAELPGQLAYLSAERISLGNLPLFSQVRRLVFITNKSEDRSIFFEWHITSPTDQEVLNIYPSKGKIRPKESKMCRISMLAKHVPAFYDMDLVCEISDLHEYTNYKRELSAWTAEKERQVHEFIITEKDPHADMRSPDVVVFVDGPPSGRLTKLEALAEGDISLDRINKYKTLPPIRQPTVDELRDIERKRGKKLSRLWIKPQPQKPFLLHLGLTARTHDHNTFQNYFPEEFKNFHIDRTVNAGVELLEPYQVNQNADSILRCSQAEATVLSSVLGGCLRQLLNDAHFADAIQKVMQEPIPYFRQFTDLQSDQLPHIQQSSSIMGSNLESSKDTEVEEAVTLGMPFHVDLTAEDNLPTPQDTEQVSLPIREHPSRLVQPLACHVDATMETKTQKRTQAIKRLPEFGHVVESVLENTLLNLVREALSSEYSIVSRPRLIALSRRHLSSLNLELERPTSREQASGPP